MFRETFTQMGRVGYGVKALHPELEDSHKSRKLLDLALQSNLVTRLLVTFGLKLVSETQRLTSVRLMRMPP